MTEYTLRSIGSPARSGTSCEPVGEARVRGPVGQNVSTAGVRDEQRRGHPLARFSVPVPGWLHLGQRPEESLPLVGAGIIPARYEVHLRLSNASERVGCTGGVAQARRIFGRSENHEVVVHDWRSVEPVPARARNRAPRQVRGSAGRQRPCVVRARALRRSPRRLPSPNTAGTLPRTPESGYPGGRSRRWTSWRRGGGHPARRRRRRSRTRQAGRRSATPI